MTPSRPDVARELARLKKFQRDTVEHVFDRMYRGERPARRYLVADEVGLGKTMIARGLVAKVAEHLWETVDRIDVVYVCSNGSIARQNINRLNISEARNAALPSRITLLPKVVRGLQDNKLNFVSLTPQTSFDLRSSLGTVEERELLYWLLPDEWRSAGIGLQNLLQGEVSKDRFRRRIADFDVRQVDAGLLDAFRQQLLRDQGLELEVRAAADQFSVWREDPPKEARASRQSVVGKLRMELATSCLNALQPDLIVLDEFQRFKHLLDGTDTAGELAKRLFDFGDARVLLLSATPYKMYTLAEESESDDHFRDFVQTVDFLMNDSDRIGSFRRALGAYGDCVFQAGGNRDSLRAARDAVEQELRSVIVRTERLTATADRNGMLTEVRPATQLEAGDISAFRAYAQIAQLTDHADVIEYWKSAPYLLNFMDDYQFKRAFMARVAGGGQVDDLRAVLDRGRSALLPWDDIERYRALDPANARLRQLRDDVIGREMWKLLWLPPAMPYYEGEGAFVAPGAGSITKRLVFSSWQVVPKVVAAVLSYEAERLMFGEGDGDERPNTPDERAKHRALLRFPRKDGEPGGMPVLALMYPSFSLAQLGDPLVIREEGGGGQSAADVLQLVERRIQDALDVLDERGSAGGRVDERWYWAAPLLLDLQRNADAARKWLDQPALPDVWRREADDAEEEPSAEPDAWTDHVVALRGMASGRSLGTPPPDLAAVLAKLAVGGPAIVALRAMSRVLGGPETFVHTWMRNYAGQIAEGFRSLFNQLDVASMIRRANAAEPYWERVLDYCVAGGLQAVMDEYMHTLQEWEGVAHVSARKAAHALSGRATQALQLRTTTVTVDAIKADRAAVTVDERRMRSRFAVRFGAKQADEGASALRADDVRCAFNSPFWPFVLCSTSVGQEGLDFHLYCHAVVHWNLPSNPVDLEQREGRVHRYKGHAVRKNAARLYGDTVRVPSNPDPWARVFAVARSLAADESDLVPYWLLPLAGGAAIERHVPLLPLSRDIGHFAALKKTLAVYRMAFGQSRQDDLVHYLASRFSPTEVDELTALMKLDLSPPVGEWAAALGSWSRPIDDEEDRQQGDDRRVGVLTATSLLDAYSAVVGSTARSNVEHYRDLLDAFTALRGEEA